MQQHKHISGINIAYIGGGSRNWAWDLMRDLALEEQLSGTVRLYDIDFEAARCNEVIGNRISDREEARGKWVYVACKSAEEALKDADFIFVSILPGTFKEMAVDVHTPEKYGIYQSVGDTTGPGGNIRSLRIVPMFVAIAEYIKKYAPDAFVINLTNPMTICTQVLYDIFPGIKAVGLCHEGVQTKQLFIKILDEMKGIHNVEQDDLAVNTWGINHFTWIDAASYGDIDLYPLFAEFSEKYYHEGYAENDDIEWNSSLFSSLNRVKFDLFRRFKVIAAPGDRHTSEFMPPWYLRDEKTVEAWKFKLTPVSWRTRMDTILLRKREKYVKGERDMKLKSSGEEVVNLLKAYLGLKDRRLNLNMPNRGQVEGMPNGFIVETNVDVSYKSHQPLNAGRVHERVASIIDIHVEKLQLLLKASYEKDKAMAFEAFLMDPLMSIDDNRAKLLFDEMLQETKAYLPGWGIK